MSSKTELAKRILISLFALVLILSTPLSLQAQASSTKDGEVTVHFFRGPGGSGGGSGAGGSGGTKERVDGNLNDSDDPKVIEDLLGEELFEAGEIVDLLGTETGQVPTDLPETGSNRLLVGGFTALSALFFAAYYLSDKKEKEQ